MTTTSHDNVDDFIVTRHTEAEAIIDIARQAAEIEEPLDGLLVGDRRQLSTLDLEGTMSAPRRPRGVTNVGDPDAVLTLLHLWLDAPQGAIGYANTDPTTGRLTRLQMVLNDHTPNNPGHADWQIHLTPQLDARWQTWTTATRSPLSQREFAELIEDRLDTIAEPAGADLLDVITTFSANTAVRFASAVNLGNGNQRLQYSEETEETSGAAGNLTVPDRITLLVPIYQGGDEHAVQLGVRYRVREAKLTIELRVIDLEQVYETATRGYLEPITDVLDVVNGSR